jgi:hypothetical protein
MAVLMDRNRNTQSLKDESIKRKEGFNYELLDAIELFKLRYIVDDKNDIGGKMVSLCLKSYRIHFRISRLPG